MTCGSDKLCYFWNLDKSSGWESGESTADTRRYANAVSLGNTVWLTGGNNAGSGTEKLTVTREVIHQHAYFLTFRYFRFVSPFLIALPHFTKTWCKYVDGLTYSGGGNSDSWSYAGPLRESLIEVNMSCFSLYQQAL